MATDKESSYVILGKIGSAFGIRGWVNVFSYTDPLSGILTYHPLYLKDHQDQLTPIEAEDGKQSDTRILMKFAGFDTPEDARTLTGKLIVVERSQLESLPKNHYYWAELEGLTVVDQYNKTLGIITHLMETGANDVIIIKGADGKEHAIPFLLNQVITRIDLDKKIMQVDWELL